ncbi:MAG: hypothetical protein JWQ11_3460 [Rhizobacter sp.]|nr:hypothetical protein [Rhizobacter sp.]
MRADCEACWAGAGAAHAHAEPSAARSSSASVVDWIAPAGSEAPMALVALPEATERFASDLAAQASARHEHKLPERPSIKMSVHTGPGWKGYVAVEMTASRIGRRALPPDAQAFVALTEDIAAGTEGSAIERHVVRAVVGPLPLDELATKKGRVAHVHALNVPESAKPERLSSVAWVQTPEGAIIAVANSIPAGCPGAP